MVTNQYMPHSPADLDVPLAALRDYFARHQIFLRSPRVADTVRAGDADPAHDATDLSRSIDRYLIDKPSESLLFAVRGDSMIDAGIHEGDFVVVIERTRTPTVGDTVLALVDNALTLKIFAEDANRRFLRGARSAW